jgi:hypothetical protein
MSVELPSMKFDENPFSGFSGYYMRSYRLANPTGAKTAKTGVFI